MLDFFPIIIAAVIILGGIALFSVFSGLKTSKNSGSSSTAMDSKKNSKILKDATKRLKQNPHHVASLVELSDCYYANHDFEHAFPLYNSLLDLVKIHPEIDEFKTSLRQGICAMKLDKTQEAFRGLTTAYKLHPNDFDSCFNLGMACYKNNDFEKAIPCLKKALIINPDASGVYQPMGQSLYKARKYRDCLKFLRRAIDEAPDNKELLFDLANAMYETGMGDKAMKVFMHLRPDPKFGPQACLIAGKMHFNAKLYDKAFQDFEIGLRIPEISTDVGLELRYNMAQTCFATNKMAMGIMYLKQIQSITPSYKDVGVLITRYQELNQNSNLRTYLMAGTSDFVALCRKVVSAFYKDTFVRITDISINPDSADILCSVESSKWEDTELFRFYRTSGIIGELCIRDFHAKIRDSKADKGFCLASGLFSEGAHKYIEGRPIDLVEKEALTKMLKKIDMLH